MAPDSDLLAEYRESTRYRWNVGIAAVLALLIAAVGAIAYGPVYIPPGQVLRGLLGAEAARPQVVPIIWNIRLPQVLAAVIAGGGLAIAGAVMQTVLRNELGSPYTLGISHAAVFGAAFSIVVLGTGSTTASQSTAVVLDNPYLTTVSAFGCSLVSTGIIVALAQYKNASPATMILTGVALGSLFTAGVTALQYVADSTELSAMVYWTFGDLSRATWGDLGLMAAVTFPATAYFVSNGWSYNALDSGDATARSLGVDVAALRLRGMVVASFVTALIVSHVGIIGFVGLVVPHIVRKLIGGDERYLLPVSAVVGGVLLLVSDTVARTAFAPLVLPVGILTSFLGAPLFIYLVVNGRDYW